MTKNEKSEVGGLVWPASKVLLKGKDKNRKLKSFTNISKLGDVMSKLVQLKRWRQSLQPPESMKVWGRSPPLLRWAIFRNFFQKK